MLKYQFLSMVFYVHSLIDLCLRRYCSTKITQSEKFVVISFLKVTSIWEKRDTLKESKPTPQTHTYTYTYTHTHTHTHTCYMNRSMCVCVRVCVCIVKSRHGLFSFIWIVVFINALIELMYSNKIGLLMLMKQSFTSFVLFIFQIFCFDRCVSYINKKKSIGIVDYRVCFERAAVV
jgi:hypothetical protein